MNLEDIIKNCEADKTDAEERLQALCKESSRLKYKDLIDRLLKITENQLHINSYKFVSFMEWLVEDLEYCKTVNNNSWDMTFKEIDEVFDHEYWKKEFKRIKGSDWNEYKTWEEFRNNYEWWGYEYCLEKVLNGLKMEYDHRKEKGLV